MFSLESPSGKSSSSAMEDSPRHPNQPTSGVPSPGTSATKGLVVDTSAYSSGQHPQMTSQVSGSSTTTVATADSYSHSSQGPEAFPTVTCGSDTCLLGGSVLDFGSGWDTGSSDLVASHAASDVSSSQRRQATKEAFGASVTPLLRQDVFELLLRRWSAANSQDTSNGAKRSLVLAACGANGSQRLQVTQETSSASAISSVQKGVFNQDWPAEDIGWSQDTGSSSVAASVPSTSEENGSQCPVSTKDAWSATPLVRQRVYDLGQHALDAGGRDVTELLAACDVKDTLASAGSTSGFGCVGHTTCSAGRIQTGTTLPVRMYALREAFDVKRRGCGGPGNEVPLLPTTSDAAEQVVDPDKLTTTTTKASRSNFSIACFEGPVILLSRRKIKIGLGAVMVKVVND
ncbi:hypothetical protein HPB50_007152 [Hyalomma asiaticum]|uniref:Uncharacterized protein n=1 Tax=Hyalomma asiaticum TaxID=266040 RepID=A0ACB7RI44_HYAAI|nr:hypothetical protein HPB50_007152 [Hyalomma asiaticum]